MQCKDVDKYTDKALITKIKQGQSWACACLWHRYQSKIDYFIFQRGIFGEERLDLRQEIGLKLFISLNQFKFESSFSTWVYRVSHNHISSYLKQYLTQPKWIFLDEPFIEQIASTQNESLSPEDQIMASERWKKLQLAMDKLPKKLSKAIQLFGIQGLSYQKIAELTHCPIGTVRSRINRARQLLK